MAGTQQLTIIIITGIALFIYIGIHLETIPNLIKYKKLLRLLADDTYRYQPNISNSIIFRKFVYNRTSGTNIPISDHIIFFPNGDIKLNENLYIWKSTRYGNLFKWYYHRKFCKMKDEKIDVYNWREMRERNAQHLHNAYIQQFKNKKNLDFKFLIG